jgi:hypothetical protein
VLGALNFDVSSRKLGFKLMSCSETTSKHKALSTKNKAPGSKYKYQALAK